MGLNKNLLSFKNFFCWLIFFSFAVSAQAAYAGQKYQELINCDIQKNACTKELSDCKLIFDIEPKPVKAMKELNFKVKIIGKMPSAEPYINLGMPGMDMGPNQVKMKAAGNGIYEGTGIIVKCPSGSTVWQATVTIPDIDKTDFVFDVIY